MKINDKVLSIPPHISTSWSNVFSIHMRDGELVINLIDGDSVAISDLPEEVLHQVFHYHALAIEREANLEDSVANPREQNLSKSPSSPISNPITQNMELPIRFGFGTLEGLGPALQHNPSQANAPDLPPEILNKISSIAKIVGAEDSSALPKPEPHCNCMFCQIAKAMHQGIGKPASFSQSSEAEEEHVSDEELKFQQWEIIQNGDKLFSVVNRLDHNEKYSVYLGHPVGCTCGKDKCEHIIAVLKS